MIIALWVRHDLHTCPLFLDFFLQKGYRHYEALAKQGIYVGATVIQQIEMCYIRTYFL